MFAFILLGPVAYVTGVIIEHGNFPDNATKNLGLFFKYAGILIIVITVVVILIGTGLNLVRTPQPAALIHEAQAQQQETATAFLLPVSQATYLPIRDYNVPDVSLDARAAIAVDSRSGTTLYAKNPDRRLPIASITKLMTALVVLERFDLDQIYEVSAEDLNLDGLGADFTKGERLRGADLLTMMLVQSSNDAAAVFATAAEAQGLDLVALMNQKAQALGMYDTHFGDPAGLDDGATYSTAKDVVTLVRAARAAPMLAGIATIQSANISAVDGSRTHRVTTTDKLLGKISGVVFGKTGNTTGALGTMSLVVTAPGGHDEIITVILGSTDRFEETEQLVSWVQHAYAW